MDSSILELREALECLTNYGQNMSAEFVFRGGSDDRGLGAAAGRCNHISEVFQGENSTLSDGWHTSAELFYKISKMVSDNLNDMYKSLVVFTSETYQAEVAARNAVDNANEAANAILGELESFFGAVTLIDAQAGGIHKPGDHSSTTSGVSHLELK